MSNNVDKGGADMVVRNYALQCESPFQRAEAREELHGDARADHNRTAVEVDKQVILRVISAYGQSGACHLTPGWGVLVVHFEAKATKIAPYDRQDFPVGDDKGNTYVPALFSTDGGELYMSLVSLGSYSTPQGPGVIESANAYRVPESSGPFTLYYKKQGLRLPTPSN